MVNAVFPVIIGTDTKKLEYAKSIYETGLLRRTIGRVARSTNASS